MADVSLLVASIGYTPNEGGGTRTQVSVVAPVIDTDDTTGSPTAVTYNFYVDYAQSPAGINAQIIDGLIAATTTAGHTVTADRILFQPFTSGCVLT